MPLEAKPIHDELASRRPASDNRQGSGCGGMTLQNHASNPPAAAQWKQDACNLYLEPRPPMARPRVPSDWPPQSLQRSRQKQDACASIPNRGRLWQGRGSRSPRVVDRPPQARPETRKGAPRQCSPLSWQGKAARPKSTSTAVVSKQTSIA